MDLKEAYEIMGLPESADREEVEKQYAVWVRKDRANRRAKPEERDESFDFEKINEAYRRILQHFHEMESAAKPKRNPRVEKLDHFWTYYKWHVIAGLIILIGIGYIINTVIENRQEQARLAQLPPADVALMMYGNFYEPDLELIEEKIMTAKPEWQRVVVSNTYLPIEVRDTFDIAFQQKAIINLHIDHSDVYMTDNYQFQSLVNLELYQPLDEYEERLKASVGEENLVYAQTLPSGLDPDEQPGEIHLYAVKLPISDLYHTAVEEIYAGVHVNSEKIENALQLIETLAQGL